MKAILTKSGCTLVREAGDKRIGKESTVVFHMRNLLNAQGYNYRRIYPDRYGLTSCKLGLAEKGIRLSDGKTSSYKTILWHERYAIENAAEEFNKSGEVFFQRIDE
jgi:hypothetical protein